MAVMAAALLAGMTACNGSMSSLGSGYTSGTSTTPPGSGSSTGNLLGSLLSTIVGNATPISTSTLVGTWNYVSPEVRFESDSYLAKAGGEVGAASIEEKLVSVYSAIGIKQGSCSYTFSEDGSITMKMGKIPVSGTYTLDASSNTLTIKTSLGKTITAKVYYSLGNLVVLYDAEKMLSMVQTISTFTGSKSTTLSTLNSLLSNYDGMLMGMNMSK